MSGIKWKAMSRSEIKWRWWGLDVWAIAVYFVFVSSSQKCGRSSFLINALSELVWIVVLCVQAMSRSEIKWRWCGLDVWALAVYFIVVSSSQKCGRSSFLVKALSEVVWIFVLCVQAMSMPEIKWRWWGLDVWAQTVYFVVVFFLFRNVVELVF